jgi:hypothetical protein
VDDGGSVDHPDAYPTHGSTAHAVGPVHEVACQSEHPAGVFEHRPGGRAQRASASVTLEELDPDPALELGETLGECRRRDTDGLGGDRPRRGLRDGDEILELADREIVNTAALNPWLRPRLQSGANSPFPPSVAVTGAAPGKRRPARSITSSGLRASNAS